jgi:hypothetical protein
METEKCVLKFRVYNHKATKLINHITQLINENPRYVISDACSANLELYFGFVNKMAHWRKKYIELTGHDIPV